MTTYKKEDIIYVTAQPDVPYFHWQVELYVHNFISLEIDPKQIHVIFSLPNGAKERTESSKRLDRLGCNIHFYEDERNKKHYIPSIKPYLISRWLKDFPKYGKIFFLHDADIIFREIPNLDVLLNDEISYLSDTISYIGYNYIKDCCDGYERQHQGSENLQLLKEMCDVVSIEIDCVKENQENSGGGQYLIKNTDWKIWDKIYLDCAPLYDQMLDYQRRFPIHHGQIQFWTAEMWSTLWNLWKLGIQTKVTNELEFCWATDNIHRYEQTPILHMAGVTDGLKGSKFYKGEYIDVNPIEKLRENPNHFDYVDKDSSTIKYIEIMKSFIKNTNKNMEIPKISIITSLKNSKEYLPQFIDDVTRQTIFEKNCEWIIIDANDNDDDYKILQPYLNQYPNIIYQRIEKDNGIYSCWNEAIKRSTGDFITNMNCDDRRSPDNLEKMAKLLHENENVSLVYCDSYIVHQSNINWELLPQNCERYNFPEFENINLLHENPPHNNPMWRRKLHIKYGFFDEKYKSAGDWDFWLRCWYNGEKFKKHPEVLGIYYWNPIGISTNTENRINFVDNEEREIFNKFNVQLESNQEKRNKKLKIKVTAQIKGFSGYNSASRNIIDQLLDLDFIDLYIDEIDPYENEKCDRISNIDFNKYDRFKVDYDYYDFNIVIYPPTENLICKKSLKNCFLFFWEMYSMHEYHYKFLNDNPELIVMSTSNFLNEIIKHNKLKNKFYKISHVHKRVKKITNKNHKVRYYGICQDVPRKNIKQTIDCFLETFKYVEDVEYNIKISKFNRDLSYWYEYLKKTDKINLITDFLTDDQIDNFHRENDIFYLCQHSEGYGIPHLDALNYGNEVVTNDFGALKDHLNEGNSYLIPYKVDFADFRELHDRDFYLYNLNSKWAVFNNQDIKRTLFNSYINFKRGIRKNKSLNLEKNNNDILYFLENETTVTNFKNPDFVIVSHDKINNSHGTGIYLSNLTKFNKNFLTISSLHLNSYFEINTHDNNDILDIKINYNDFKHIDISLNNESIKEYFNEKVKNINTKKILSVPYFVDDVINTILLKNKTGAKLVTYIMDDQNIIHNNIPDDLMRELLEKSDLRLCISKDMCREYNKKYGLDFYFLPPLVKNESIKKEYTFTHEEWVNTVQKNPGVMVGNIWNPKWLDELSKLTKNLNIQINWFSPQKINDDKIVELRECGINYLGHRSESDLLDILNSSPFGLILTSLNEDDDRKDLTFSLSSKLTHMMSAANLPIISVGDKKTTNSKFVKEMNIGLNSEYTINELQDCINEIMNFSSQEKFRKNSYYIGNQLNIDYHCQSKNLEQSSINWIWESCEIGKPINNKYENLIKTLKNSRVIVSAIEVNNLHGTGPLIKRVAGDEDNTLVILSKLNYDFKNDFGDVVLHIDSSRINRQNIIHRLGNNEIEQILCVPYFKEDLITSIALHDEFNVPMGCYIMDDQNIVYNNIPDDLMFEFLSKCSARFVTHPELRDAYENKFKLKFYIIPQIVPDELINKEEYDCEKNSNGAIIGSIWSYNWLKKLCQTLKESNIKVDWYGNNKYPWLNETDEELISYGLNPVGLLSEEELSKKLKSYPYVIVPYGTLEDDDNAKNLTRLSLPGRIIFASVTSNIPIIVMGSEKCSAAQFVTKFGIGTVCDYNGNSLIEAINFVKENEKELRKNAFLIANNFSSEGVDEFLWQSIRWYKRPFDLRFENIFNGKYEMNSYSQHGEDLVIYDYFKGRTGNFLDIGANDGITISNTCKLLKNGWSGTYIEGSPFVFDKLKSNVIDTGTQCLNYFLSNKKGYSSLYCNTKIFDESMPKETIDMLSTIDEKSYLRCKEWGSFRQMEIECFTFYDIEKELEFNEYQVISIDIEGLDYEVLSQIDLNKYGTEIVVIEYNHSKEKRKEIIDYCNNFSLYKIIFDNQINIIIAK